MTNPLRTLFPDTPTTVAGLPWPNEHADRGYAIFFTGRCGSTELVDCLAQSGECGAPDEFFNEEYIPHHNAAWNCSDLGAYVANIVRSRAAGRVFGFKIDGFRHRRLAEIVDPASLFRPDAFRFIYMNRRDLVEQSYSYAHAKLTGIWHRRTTDQGRKLDPVDVPDLVLWREMALVLEQEFYFERYFIENTLPILRIDYEGLCTSKQLLVTDVMLQLNCRREAIESAVSSMQSSRQKLDYDISKVSRLIDFKSKFAAQIAHLTTFRGRLPFASVRNYLRLKTGLDVSQGA